MSGRLLTHAEAGPRSQRQRGVALIIVLAFVVILTGVILAYFSRSIASREVSNSSANQTKVDLFAQGAADRIIGNLQQEIVNLSTATTVTSGTVSTTFYTPKNPIEMLPISSVGSSSTAPNLLIRSVNGQFFDSTFRQIAESAAAVSS